VKQLLDENRRILFARSIADIVGEHGALLRGKSDVSVLSAHSHHRRRTITKWAGFLAIPDGSLGQGTKDRRCDVEDRCSRDYRWTSPQLPLDPELSEVHRGVGIVAKEADRRDRDYRMYTETR
jgi:hypothetical protein